MFKFYFEYVWYSEKHDKIVIGPFYGSNDDIAFFMVEDGQYMSENSIGDNNLTRIGQL